MLAFGLASVPFFNGLYARWMEIHVDLPQIESDAPLYIQLPAKLPEPESIAQDRNLFEYNFGGTFSNCAWMKSPEWRKCAVNNDKARNFILNNWQAKKRAYIVYEWTGVDNGNDFYYFIEPDENGRWHIIKRWEIVFPTYDAGFFQQVKSQDIRDVKRKSIPKDDYWKSGKYYLQFFDADGNESGSL